MAVCLLAIPLYCIPASLIALTRRSPYSPWPPLLVTLGWAAQWPAIFVMGFILPGAPSFGGDGQASLPFDLAMFVAFIIYNAVLSCWVYRHRRRFLPEE